MSSVDAVTENELVRLRRELDRLRAENVRLSRLLDLRGQDGSGAGATRRGGRPTWVGRDVLTGRGQAGPLRRPVPGPAGCIRGALGEDPNRGNRADARGGRRVAGGARVWTGGGRHCCRSRLRW